MAEFKKRYEELSSKHGFPTLDQLLKVVDIDPTEESATPLKDITEKLVEKLDDVQKLLDIILEPEPKFTDLTESKEFSDADKDNLVAVFRKSMILKRSAMISLFESTEESKVEIIRQFFSEWPEIRDAVVNALDKMRESWTKEVKYDKEVGYLG
jgi:hypothetical protein